MRIEALTLTTGSRSAWPPARPCGAGCPSRRWGWSGRARAGRWPGRSRQVGGDDDGAVHLAQLAQPLGAELDVEVEAAGGELLDDLVVAEHDEGAGVAAQDPLEPVAQRGAGGDGGEGATEQLVGGRHAALVLLSGGSPTGGACRSLEINGGRAAP
jgi:hypothetical protein